MLFFSIPDYLYDSISIIQNYKENHKNFNFLKKLTLFIGHSLGGCIAELLYSL